MDPAHPSREPWWEYEPWGEFDFPPLPPAPPPPPKSAPPPCPCPEPSPEEFVPGGTERSPLPVARVVKILNGIFRDNPSLLFYICGELSEYRPQSSGHLYFSLRDHSGSDRLNCKMWNSRVRAKRLDPQSFKEGDAIIVQGRFNLYGKQGKLDFEAFNIIPAGRGGLLEELERLRRRLAQEGLFAEEHKRPLPAFPRLVGVATSPAGQAIQDICRTLKDRAPHVRLVLAPCLCQGPKADLSIMEALERLKGYPGLDCVIVGRGGGSQEDLQPYNSEALVRYLYAYPLPTISAVGHEGDYSLTDFVADQRASTPTRAAELVAAPRQQYLEELRDLAQRLLDLASRRWAYQRESLQQLAQRWPRALRHQLQRYHLQLENLRQKLELLHPRKNLGLRQERLAELESRLKRLGPRWLEEKKAALQLLRERLERYQKGYLPAQRQALERLASQLELLAPERVLERGYALVTNAQGQVVRASTSLQKGEFFQVRFQKGSLEAKVQRRLDPLPPDQIELF